MLSGIRVDSFFLRSTRLFEIQRINCSAERYTMYGINVGFCLLMYFTPYPSINICARTNALWNTPGIA